MTSPGSFAVLASLVISSSHVVVVLFTVFFFFIILFYNFSVDEALTAVLGGIEEDDSAVDRVLLLQQAALTLAALAQTFVLVLEEAVHVHALTLTLVVKLMATGRTQMVSTLEPCMTFLTMLMVRSLLIPQTALKMRVLTKGCLPVKKR